jgi:polysaccharide deacetylase family protein (PEP-CTERM system associated)
MYSIMSVDVEEWFHIPSGTDNIIPFDEWHQSPQRIQIVLPRMLDIFEKNHVKGTFFFLGWIAEKYPFLVKETLKRGHEVATHGYCHRLIYTQSREEFREDIHKSISLIEDITGRSVIGYRAPGFSITPETAWAFDILSENGIKYDSSIFPGKRYYGHFRQFGKAPALIRTNFNDIIEFPQTVVDFGLFRLSCFGGGYFRLFPEVVFMKMSEVIFRNTRPLIMYIHPRDIDIDQPRIKFSFLKNMRHYINISKTTQKLENITGKIKFTSFEKVISDDEFILNLNNSISYIFTDPAI